MSTKYGSTPLARRPYKRTSPSFAKWREKQLARWAKYAKLSNSALLTEYEYHVATADVSIGEEHGRDLRFLQYLLYCRLRKLGFLDPPDKAREGPPKPDEPEPAPEQEPQPEPA